MSRTFRLIALLSVAALLGAAPYFRQIIGKNPRRRLRAKPAAPAAAKPAADKVDPDANDTFKQLALFSDVLERVRRGLCRLRYRRKAYRVSFERHAFNRSIRHSG